MALAGRVAAAALGVSVRVASDTLARFPELAHMRVRRGGIPPRVAGWALLQSSVAAITLGSTVFLARDTPSPDQPLAAPLQQQLNGLLLHELRHVQQFREDKFFPIRYLWGILRSGYEQNRYEVEAREFARGRLSRAERS